MILALRNEKKDPEQKPEDNIQQNQDKPDKSDILSKPTKLDLKPNIVICDILHSDMKDMEVDDKHIILEDVEKKAE